MSKNLNDLFEKISQTAKNYDPIEVNMPIGIIVSGSGTYYMVNYSKASSIAYKTLNELIIETFQVLDENF